MPEWFGHGTWISTILCWYSNATLAALTLQPKGLLEAQAPISPLPFTPILTQLAPYWSEWMAPPVFSMLSRPMGANSTQFSDKIVRGETVISSKLNGSSDSLILAVGLRRTNFFWRNRYIANVSTPSTGIGLLPCFHSMSLGPVLEDTRCEYSEADLLRLVSRHHPPPWQLNAPTTPVNWYIRINK